MKCVIGLGEYRNSWNSFFLSLLITTCEGDNWNGIMKDTLREECEEGDDCLRNCCVSPYFAPLFFVVFVLMAQFVLVNVVVAVLMKHLEESHKQVKCFLMFNERYDFLYIENASYNAKIWRNSKFRYKGLSNSMMNILKWYY